MKSQTRISPDSVWPLRGADGLTFAERKANERRGGLNAAGAIQAAAAIRAMPLPTTGDEA